MRSISEVEAQLRQSLAAPKLAIAVEITLPLIRAYYEELRDIAMMIETKEAEEKADKWLTAVLLCEHAFKAAGPPLTLKRAPRPELVDSKRRVQ
jgi:hypothetical protein